MNKMDAWVVAVSCVRYSHKEYVCRGKRPQQNLTFESYWREQKL
jgi:hypothetical protein